MSSQLNQTQEPINKHKMLSWIPTMSGNLVFSSIVLEPKTDRTESRILYTTSSDPEPLNESFFLNSKNKLTIETFRILNDSLLFELFPLREYGIDFYKKYLTTRGAYGFRLTVKKSEKDIRQYFKPIGFSQCFKYLNALDINIEQYSFNSRGLLASKSILKYDALLLSNGLVIIEDLNHLDTEDVETALFEIYSLIRDTWHDHKFHNETDDKIVISNLVTCPVTDRELLNIYANLESDLLEIQRGYNKGSIDYLMAQGFGLYTQAFNTYILSKKSENSSRLSTKVSTEHLQITADILSKREDLTDSIKWDGVEFIGLVLSGTGLYFSWLQVSETPIKASALTWFIPLLIVYFILWWKTYTKRTDPKLFKHGGYSLQRTIIRHYLEFKKGKRSVYQIASRTTLNFGNKILYMCLLHLRILLAIILTMPLDPVFLLFGKVMRFRYIKERLLLVLYRKIESLQIKSIERE